MRTYITWLVVLMAIDVVFLLYAIVLQQTQRSISHMAVGVAVNAGFVCWGVWVLARAPS